MNMDEEPHHRTAPGPGPCVQLARHGHAEDAGQLERGGTLAVTRRGSRGLP